MAPRGLCHGCWDEGHAWQRCPHRPKGGIPAFLKRRGRGSNGKAQVADEEEQDDKAEAVVGEAVAAVGEEQPREGWWIDSGANHNFTPYASDFKSSALAAGSSSSFSPLTLAHRRLGHTAPTTLQQMARGNSVLSLEIGGGGSTDCSPCEPCLLGKSARKSFPHEASRALGPLDEVHMDLWGPVRTPSLGGVVYVLSLIDDFTRRVWSFPLPNKESATVAKVLRQWHKNVELECGRKLKAVRSDRGGEFLGDAVKAWKAEFGIKTQLSVADTPQQNGVVERWHRTMAEGIRTLLVDSGLPARLWGEALMWVVWVKNMVTHSALPASITPMEAWSGQKPHVGMARIWGCMGSVMLHGHEKGGKLDARAVMCICVGVDMESRGWRMLDPSLMRIRIARDVDFPENVMWKDWDKAKGFGELLQDAAAISQLLPLPLSPPSAPADDVEMPPSSLPPAPLSVSVQQQPTPLQRLSGPSVIQRRSATQATSSSSSSGQRSVPLSTGAPPSPATTSPPPVTGLQVLGIQSGTGGEEVGGDAGVVEGMLCLAREVEGVALAGVSTGDVPRTLVEALCGPEGPAWKEGAEKEVNAMRTMGVWDPEPVDLPPGKKAIGVRSVKDGWLEIGQEKYVCGLQGRFGDLLKETHKSLIGSLMYAAVTTRPDMSFTVNTLAQSCVAPRRIHMRAALRALSRPAATTVAAAARATAAASGGAAGSTGGAAGAGGAGPTTDHHCLSWPLSRQLQRLGVDSSGHCLSRTTPPLSSFRCVPGRVEAAALGSSESVVAPGAGESVAALGARECADALGASVSTATGPASTEALHTFTLDSSASRCFFRDCTIFTPLATPVPVFARASTVLPCPAVPSRSLVTQTRLGLTTWLRSGRHRVTPSAFIPGGQREVICKCSQTGRYLAMFTRQPESGLYTLSTASAQVAKLDSPLAPPPRSPLAATSPKHALPSPCLWPSQILALPPSSPAPPCLPCVEGRQRDAPHSSEFPPTTAPLQTLLMDVWGPAPVGGTDQERYFLLVVDDYRHYTTVFLLWRKADVSGVLIPCIRATRRQLHERFRRDFPVLRLHSDRGGEISSDLLAEFCRDEGIRQSFTLPASPQQNGIAEDRIGLIMEVAHTSMIHAATPHFLWTFAWTGKVGDALVFRVWGALSLVRDAKVSKLSSCTLHRVFLGFPINAPPWQFYHLCEHRVFSSEDVTFDESVYFYRLHPPRSPYRLFSWYQSYPPVDPLPPQGPAPLGVSQVDPPPLVEPLEISSDSSGPAEGGDSAADDTAATRRSPRLETPLGFPPRPSLPPPQPAAVDSGAETTGAEPRGAETEGEGSGGAATEGAATWGAGSGGAATGATAA
ncbi:unnamed protein product [Closterium sp. NIES-53]